MLLRDSGITSCASPTDRYRGTNAAGNRTLFVSQSINLTRYSFKNFTRLDENVDHYLRKKMRVKLCFLELQAENSAQIRRHVQAHFFSSPLSRSWSSFSNLAVDRVTGSIRTQHVVSHHQIMQGQMYRCPSQTSRIRTDDPANYVR